MDMNLLKYLVFVKIVEYGSFTKASEVLNYSQSGISRMINDLESDWNLTLLERSRSGIRLTPDGARILPYARKLCDEYQNLQLHVEELQGLQSGLIRIGTFSSVATHWIPKIITAFQKDYPGIEYEILLGDYTEIEDWIDTGRVDCGFLRLPTRSEFDTITIASDHLMVILPQGHPLAAYEKVPIKKLCDYPFMLLEKGARAEIADVLERNNVKPDVRFTTWDDYAVMSMVESGLGISILPELILKRIPYNIVVKELNVPARRTIGLAMKDRRFAPLAVRRFIEYLGYIDSGNQPCIPAD